MLLSWQVDVYIYMYFTCYIWMDINWICFLGYLEYGYIFIFIYFYILPNHISMISWKTLRFLSIRLLGWTWCVSKAKDRNPTEMWVYDAMTKKTCKHIDSRHIYCMNIDSNVHIKIFMHVLLPHVIAMYTYMYAYVFSACTIPYVAVAW